MPVTTFRSALLAGFGASCVLAATPAIAQVEPFVPVTDAMLENPEPADWLMWRRTLDSWGVQPAEPDRPGQCG